ncbi:phage holin family protein [Candidatus Roizmanbacteria bacterium]|nr:phage holin family protein [Candidatus Roizmanbacteria bacterium]
MKTILRNLIIYSFILFLLNLLIPGVTINGGLWTFFIGGLTLTIFFAILKPILSIISFPVNVITLGIFNIFINALLLYLLTIFITEISITAFTYARTSIFGIIFPVTSFNTFFAYIYTAFVLTVINSFIRWLIS